MGMTEGTLTPGEGASLELDDIQSGALHERPVPYVGRYLLLRIDDRAAGRELVRRLHPFVDSGRSSADPAHDAWITAAIPCWNSGEKLSSESCGTPSTLRP